MWSKIGCRDVINRRSLATGGCIHSREGVHWRYRQNQMAAVIVSKWGSLALVLRVLKGKNGCRVIFRIETGHSNLVSCFGPRIRALAQYFTSAFASVKYLSQHPHPRAKRWHKIWMCQRLVLNRRQAITWTNADLLSNGPLGVNLSEIVIKIWISLLKKCISRCHYSAELIGGGGANSNLCLHDKLNSRFILDMYTELRCIS